MFIIYGNVQIVPGKYNEWQAAYDKLGDYVWKNESKSTLTYYFGVPIEYKGALSATQQMLAFEVYGKREGLYETHFNSPAMGRFLSEVPDTMTTGLDLTHYEDTSGFLDRSGTCAEGEIIYDTRILCHNSQAREGVVEKLSAIAEYVQEEEKGTHTFWVLKSLDQDDEVRIFERYQSWNSMETHQKSQKLLEFWYGTKKEIKSMEGRAFVPNGKGWLHR